MSDRLGHELLALLGNTAFVAFTEAFGGQRLYVPKSIGPDHDITRAIGETAARKLSARYCPAVLRIPIARWHRARHYRASGYSNAEIASRLCMPETSVERGFRRMDDLPPKGGYVADEPLENLPLFPEL